MSVLTARMAASNEDWAFVQRAMPQLAKQDGEVNWEWLLRHVGRDANVLALEEGGELVGFIVYQAVEGILWVTSLFTRPGAGSRHDWALVRILSEVAEQYDVGQIGFRSIRPGFLRVLTDRLGLEAQVRTYTEYRISLPLLGEEASHAGNPAVDDDHAASAAASG